ncbi:ParB/RepB/Spo0J family partition protein [Rhodovulum visakhapatnamense]|uniref:ParB family chromosome partitioning protein n=1 Tax=Rhodovulum visakhapatnamense TaxID=364297 RepID=A0A4R8FQQ4_9RHOB|nr:plasmid partitioning protein RepB C-terminal domain-containing protein [Rhodovulum visakhapatnamense]TDX28861.1 ParB family chromosome partitioning protein [Rhodovulum visakhapatnamense]
MVRQTEAGAEVQTVPIAAITGENPRARSEKTFRATVDSIGKVGLKKPITVARDDTASGNACRLVCGRGRMEAYVALGGTHIPAIVVDATEVDRLLRSVIETVARRQQRPLELLQDIATLRNRKYSDQEMAEKTGLSQSCIQETGELIANGEERLPIAVETGQMPLSVALYIIRAEEKDVQKALEAAYASGELRGKKLLEARRLVELRHRHGKKDGATRTKRSGVRMTSAAMVRADRVGAERQQDMIRRAQATRGHLLFLDAAFQSALGDETFLTLLRAEGLDSLPTIIVEGLKGPRT